jgi:hypothetical protein
VDARFAALWGPPESAEPASGIAPTEPASMIALRIRPSRQPAQRLAATQHGPSAATMQPDRVWITSGLAPGCNNLVDDRLLTAHAPRPLGVRTAPMPLRSAGGFL